MGVIHGERIYLNPKKLLAIDPEEWDMTGDNTIFMYNVSEDATFALGIDDFALTSGGGDVFGIYAQYVRLEPEEQVPPKEEMIALGQEAIAAYLFAEGLLKGKGPSL